MDNELKKQELLLELENLIGKIDEMKIEKPTDYEQYNDYRLRFDLLTSERDMITNQLIILQTLEEETVVEEETTTTT